MMNPLWNSFLQNAVDEKKFSEGQWKNGEVYGREIP